MKGRVLAALFDLERVSIMMMPDLVSIIAEGGGMVYILHRESAAGACRGDGWVVGALVLISFGMKSDDFIFQGYI